MNSKKIAAAPLTGKFSGAMENAPIVRAHAQQQQHSSCPQQERLRAEKAQQQQQQQPQL